jgi:hypothetical protein
MTTNADSRTTLLVDESAIRLLRGRIISDAILLKVATGYSNRADIICSVDSLICGKIRAKSTEEIPDLLTTVLCESSRSNVIGIGNTEPIIYDKGSKLSWTGPPVHPTFNICQTGLVQIDEI